MSCHPQAGRSVRCYTYTRHQSWHLSTVPRSMLVEVLGTGLHLTGSWKPAAVPQVKLLRAARLVDASASVRQPNVTASDSCLCMLQEPAACSKQSQLVTSVSQHPQAALSLLAVGSPYVPVQAVGDRAVHLGAGRGPFPVPSAHLLLEL